MTDPDPGAGHVPPPGMARITQAERSVWQRRAAHALIDILTANPGLPAITWIVGTGTLAGQVNGVAPEEDVREAFTGWQAALRLETVREVPNTSTGVTHLSGHGRHRDVSVSLTARVYDSMPGEEDPAQAPTASNAVQQAKGATARGGTRTPRAGRPGIRPTTPPGQLQARPPSGSQQRQAPRPAQSY
jgi:hypothetical protein